MAVSSPHNDQTHRRPPRWHQILLPSVLGASVLALWRFAVAGRIPGLPPQFTEVFETGFVIAGWALVALGMIRLMNRLVWFEWMMRRQGRPASSLVVQISTMVIGAAFAGLVAGQAFALPITGLLTTSGILIAIIGFALRNIISDVFTGFALGVEGSFEIGDWVEIDGQVGQVTEINWRATSLLTRDGIQIVVPNSLLASETLRNYSRPGQSWRDELSILLPYSVTSHRAERLLGSAVQGVPELAQLGREPEVRLGEYTENGVRWLIRYWLPDYPSLSRLRYEVHRNVLRNLHYAAVEVPSQRVDIYSAGQPVPHAGGVSNLVSFLENIDLFEPLEPHEIEQLALSIRERLVTTEEAVVRQGDAGDSLFILREGLLDVVVSQAASQPPVTVNQMRPGSFFGEVSLMTGEPRTATVVPSVDSVVLELPRLALLPLLQARPELAERFSETLERRVSHTRRVLQRRENGTPTADTPSRGRFLSRIRALFRLD